MKRQAISLVMALAGLNLTLAGCGMFGGGITATDQIKSSGNHANGMVGTVRVDDAFATPDPSGLEVHASLLQQGAAADELTYLTVSGVGAKDVKRVALPVTQ